MRVCAFRKNEFFLVLGSHSTHLRTSSSLAIKRYEDIMAHDTPKSHTVSWERCVIPQSGLFSFVSFWDPSSEFNMRIALTLGIIVVAVVALICVLAFFRKNKSTSLIVDMDDSKFITSILQRSKELHVRFDIVCTRPNLKHRHLQAHCRSIPQEGHVVIDAIQRNSAQKASCLEDIPEEIPVIVMSLAAGSIPAGWDDAPVDVYFQLSQQGQSMLYHFASFVRSIKQYNQGTQMELIMPSVLLDSLQKEAIRIEPTAGMIALTSLWFFPAGFSVLPKQVANLGKAQATYRPEGNSDFRICSISANRTRLRFLDDVLKDLPTQMEEGTQVVMLLAINVSPQNNERMLLWLKATCVAVLPCAEQDCLDVKFAFSHWQHITKRSDVIDWHPASDSERIPPILHWILSASAATPEVERYLDVEQQAG